MPPTQTQLREVPVVFFNYNRPDCTKQVARRIVEWAPRKLYIFCDGPKPGAETSEITKVHNVLKDTVWNSEEVHLNFRKTNFGCKKAIETGLDHVFCKERYAIILEDDTVPNLSFFSFVARLLLKHEKNTNIAVVSGFNYVGEVSFTNNSYFASNLLPIWGWGTWNRCWKDHRSLSEQPSDKKLFKAFSQRLPRSAAKKIAKETKLALIKEHTWDFPFFYTLARKKQLTLISSKNLIENIGFDHRATHPLSKPIFGNIGSFKASEKADPIHLIPNRSYEKKVLRMSFGNHSIRKKSRLLVLFMNHITRGCYDGLGSSKPRLKVLLFGAGAGGSNIYNLLRNRYQIIGFIDNSKTGIHSTGLPIIAPKEVRNISFNRIIIASQYAEEIHLQCIKTLKIPESKIITASADAITGFYNLKKAP